MLVTFVSTSLFTSNFRYSAVNWVNSTQSSSAARRFHFQVGAGLDAAGKEKLNVIGWWSERFVLLRTLH